MGYPRVVTGDAGYAVDERVPSTLTPAGRLRVEAAVSAGGGSSSLTTGQNALSTAAELVVAANASRRFMELKNTDAAISIYFGADNGVTTATGHLLKAGESFGFENYVGALWAIAASGTPTVTFVEW